MPITLLAVALSGLSAGMPPTSAKSQFKLSALTVPQDRLPKGCRLGPDAPGTFRENPWVGNEAGKLSTIRLNLEGNPQTDDPVAARARGAENVLEGYFGRYVADDGGRIQAMAVLFDDPKWTVTAALTRLNGELQPRIIRGPVAAVVSWAGPTTRVKGTAITEACYKAVQAFISAATF